MKKRYLILILIILSIVSLFIGVKNISITEIFNLKDDKTLVMITSRIPRVVAIILAGIGMSVSGLIMQQISHNKFVSPTTAGTMDASKMGILFATLLIPHAGTISKMLFAFVMTFLASFVFLRMIERIKYRNFIFIPLVGIMFGNVLNAISTFFAYKFNIVQSMNAWLIGDFASVMKGRYELLYFSVPVIIMIYSYANKFTVVGMGESFSKNLGLNYSKVVNLGLISVSITVSVIMITVGSIPFLGLIIPNIVSILYGDNLRKTLPYIALLGSIFLMVCDILGRLIIFPYEVPIGIMVGIIGGILFFYLLFKKK